MASTRIPARGSRIEGTDCATKGFRMPITIPPIVAMGVQGAGKSTIGSLLAERLGLAFVDGDDLHSEESIAMMAAGIALDDASRLPWLHEVGRVLADRRDEGIVVACSALKRSYRDLLREYAPDAFIVHSAGSMELVAARISERQHEYMPPSLLSSQYAALEPLGTDETGVVADILQPPAKMVDEIVTALEAESPGQENLS